ncbi:hypothetical protein EV363DRAFT_1428288, partial [Boletus edulis]
MDMVALPTLIRFRDSNFLAPHSHAMEWSRIIVLEIAAASQRVVGAATEYARRRGLRNVQSCHFRLEKEMQQVSVAAGGILGALGKSSLPNGPPLDDRLQDWFSTDELPICLDTLHQMEKMLRDNTWMNAVFNFVNTLWPLPPEDKIDAAVKLFDSRRHYFHFLLTTDVWNREDAQQQPRVCSAHAQDEAVVQRLLLPNPNSSPMEVEQDNISVPLSMTNRATAVEEKITKPIDARGKLDDILRWLDGLSCAAKHEETLSLRQPDTCTWLHSTPEYRSWRNSEDTFLWLQGKPGSGKTILASFAIDSLENKRLSGEALVFFYCDFRNDRSTSAAEVMRSLLYQLLRRIRYEESDPGELIGDLVKEKNGDTPILKNVKHLATFVSRTSKQFSHQPLVVVDALDECEDVKTLLDGLLILAKGGMRLFVTSRPLQAIKDRLCGLPSISMDNMTSAVSADIALHVTRELDSSPRLRALDRYFKMEIYSILCDRADGMFRWVQCQIDALNRCATKAEVRRALDNLPIGLDETYQRILTAIDLRSSDGKLTLRALVWLVGALRPLRLVEILEGLTIDLGRQTLDPESGAMHKGILLYACGSLVTYNEKTDIVILSHFSVKEYITGNLTRIKLPQYHISHQGAHEHLARICICYIALYLKHIHASSESTSQHRIMRTINDQPHNTTRVWSYVSNGSPAVFSSQELLSYVFTDGFNHLAHLGPANHVVLKDMVTLQSDIQRHPTAWENICWTSQRYKLLVPWPGPEHDFMLYVLTAFASDSLLRAFLGPTRRTVKPRYRTNPLVYAAHFGKPQHAQLLLSHGAKVNERGLVVQAYRQDIPLEVAVSRQHDAMVDLLLSTGSVVPKQLFTRTTDRNFPIRIARRLLQTDEFMEWVAERGNKPPSPLGLLERRLPSVYERDILVMIRRLVQVGLDPAARNSAQKAALHIAITERYEAVVVYLLLLGTPLPSDFMSAVSKVPSSERIPMLRLIVNAGADVGVAEGTSLHLAIRALEEDECLEAVKILVGAGCELFVYDKTRKTPLHVALERKYFTVMDYLLLRQQPVPLDALSAVVENIRGVTASGDGLLHRAV